MASRPAQAPKQPFYTQVTYVKEVFTNGEGQPASIDLPLITLPKGTVLFRALKLPDVREGQDIRYFYRDFLGNPESINQTCVSPVHNTFFYPFPYVAFGANDIGKTFNTMQAVVLVHPITVVCAISPSPFVRGMAQRYTGTAPWQRCSGFKGPDYDCHEMDWKEDKAKTYDNCLNPEYQVRSGTRGWMALADLDSLNPKTRGQRQGPMKDSTMGAFIQKLEAKAPGEGAKALSWAYTDDTGHAGYPELAIYPYRTHQGLGPKKKSVMTEDMAMRYMESTAAADNFNYLPLAAFTKSHTIDMVNGDFNTGSLAMTMGNYDPSSAQEEIIQNTMGYMWLLQTQGLDLPFYGRSKLCFDSRTGFFVLDAMVPKNLSVAIPRPILNAESRRGNAKVFPATPYRFLLMPMEDEEQRRRALIYSLMFRNHMPENFMKKYKITNGFAFRRAMVFSRFPVMTVLFKELEIEMPQQFKEPLYRAGQLYKEEGPPKRKVVAAAANATVTDAVAGAPAPRPVAAAAAMPVALPGAVTPPYAPATPPYAPATPPYAPATPPYAPSTPPGPGPDPHGGITPNYAPVSPKGGRRTRRVVKNRRRTRRAKSLALRPGPFSMFKSVWKAYRPKHQA